MESSAVSNSQIFTEKEREVLALVCGGLTDKEIALALDRAPQTIKNRLQRIFRKSGTRSRAQAAVLFAKTQAGTFD
jgi:DNA-binding NarL/FixJ family response regulator